MRLRKFLPIAGIVMMAAVGCGTSEVPHDNADGSQATQNISRLAKATLHINGFKKSKSGAI